MADDGSLADANDPIQVIDEGPCKRRLVGEIPAERVHDEVESRYFQLRKNFQMPGFRPGKVPRSVLERRFSKQIEDEVKEELLQNSFQEEVEKRDLRLVAAPSFDKVDFKIGSPFRFEAVFEIAPTFDLPEYKGVSIAAEPIEVSDDDVEAELEGYLEQSASWEALGEDQTAEEGDVAFLSVRIPVEDGEDYEREGVFLKLGEDRIDDIPIEGVSARFVGSRPEAQIEVSATLPDSFEREDLRGKEVSISLTAKDFRRESKPKLDDAFAKRFGVESVDELRRSIREAIEARSRRAEERRQEDAIVAQIVDAAAMDLPEGVVEEETRARRHAAIHERLRAGMPKEEAEAEVATLTGFEDEAKRALRETFVLGKIAEEEAILVTEDEIAHRLGEMAQLYQTSPAQLFEEYRKRGMLMELRNGLLKEKVRQFLRKKATVSGADGAASDAAADQ